MLERYHLPKQPPRAKNFDGAPRRVGVELEFAALSARDVANEIHKTFGGTIIEIGRHRFVIQGSGLGDFKTELDTRYAHKPDNEKPPGDDPIAASFQSIADALREIYGDISSLIVPCEIVAPPIEIADIAQLDRFVTQLISAGALGTNSSAFYAFGTHLNPDIATRDPNWILAVLKAEILLSSWLRDVMAINLTRWFAAFADPFPRAYIYKVLDTSYWPETAQLIGDYLELNPTRDRELDMLPLFAWLEPSVVKSALPDAKISARPTFHFRLPNANLGVPGWSVGLEWNRWCVIERLAEDRELLDAMCVAYLENDRRMLPERWALRASEWLIV
ncbi:MAG: amidoligase family protein [Hyphomicrobiaceae bacterium]|nr:amidoligase family protein [Hyphomicrobiaceae bacterium]